jgi:hypothetical protein
VIVDDYTLRALIQRWEPPVQPHCSDCRWACVSGNPRNPTVRCAKGQGRVEMSLAQLIRASRPLQFRPARACPYFESMEDGL